MPELWSATKSRQACGIDTTLVTLNAIATMDGTATSEAEAVAVSAIVSKSRDRRVHEKTSTCRAGVSDGRFESAIACMRSTARKVGSSPPLVHSASCLKAIYTKGARMAALTARLFGLEAGLRYGLVLMAMAAGAEIGPLLTATSSANVRLSGGLLVLSIAITIVYLPLMLGVFLPDAHVPVGHLLLKLSLTIVMPLLLGLFIKSRFEKMAESAETYLHLVSRVFVVLLTVIVLLLFYERIIRLFGTSAILAALISVVGGFGIGYLLGWPDRGTRLAMGYMHGARSASIAVMVASDVFRDQPNVMLMIAIVTLLILVILLPLSFMCKIRSIPTEASLVPPAATTPAVKNEC
jgi:BASS family bile acid:Na+ symporter